MNYMHGRCYMCAFADRQRRQLSYDRPVSFGPAAFRMVRPSQHPLALKSEQRRQNQRQQRMVVVVVAAVALAQGEMRVR